LRVTDRLGCVVQRAERVATERRRRLICQLTHGNGARQPTRAVRPRSHSSDPYGLPPLPST
jgi:hypothetical protein